ncbi:hypothetical protein [Streptomyces venezuelae]|uniref:hypothetical protein n=1 Tax=Streptomyces venezuelae TaxID=54571 RepID=UPI0037BA6130
MINPADATQSPPTQVLIEVRPGESSGDLAPRVVLPEQFRSRAGEIAGSIADVADQFRLRLEGLMRQPTGTGWGVETIEIGFDISVQAESGVVIAKAAAGATFSARVTLKAPQESQ